LLNDPIVEEVHQLRKKLMAECDGDLDRLLARLREREEEDASRVVSSVDEGQRRLRSTTAQV
jgi:hypothetical protein